MVNVDGELAGAWARCRARSIPEARDRFLTGLMPALDHLSYLGNSPLIVERVLCRDLKNDVHAVDFTMPYDDVAVTPGAVMVRQELIPIYALYREAKNSSSKLYRFLCYFKILEGIYEHFRPELFRLAREQGKSIATEKERIPDHPELRRFQEHYIGQPIKEFSDNELRATFRDGVAHYFLEHGVIINPSDPRQTSSFGRIILPTELSCRVVIERQEQYYEQFYGTSGSEKGTAT